MKTPTALQPLIDDGVIDEVLRSLKSGKEATVYLVRTGAQTRCAKVYRDMGQRSFQRRAQYQEGRKVRGSRQARAMNKSTRFGRGEQEAAWKNAEVDHRVPLYRVWNEYRGVPWPDLLHYWGLPNLQVINRDAHVLKCADEARDRSVKRSPPAKDASISNGLNR